MEYKKLVEVYEKLEKTTKRLEKRDIIAEILRECKEDELDKVIYLLQGRVFPQFDERKIGMSSRLILKVISKVSGETVNEVERQWKKIGDLGEVTSFLVKKKKQSTLKLGSKLTINKVFDNLLKISEFEGEGTVNKKIDLVSELIANASPVEAKFVVRTVLEDLRIGVAEGVLRDAVALAYDVDVKTVEKAFDVLVDYGEVAKRAKEKKLGELSLVIGRPFKVMFAIKVNNIEEAFEEVGKPALFEYKLDGFRCITGNTPIYCLNKGYISVKDLKKGDSVLTHRGNFKKVIALNKRIIDKKERLFEVQTFLGLGFRISEGHRILVSRKNKNIWIPVEKITKKDLFAFPIPRIKEESKLNGSLVLSDDSGYFKKIKIDSFFFRFLGFWIGDGFTNNHHNTERVGLLFNKKTESKLCDYYYNGIKNRFSIKNVTKSVQGNLINLYFRDKPFRIWLSQNFRQEWKCKKLPVWFLGINKKQFESFIQGYLESDGYVDNLGRSSITTKERNLAMFIQLLALKFKKVYGLQRFNQKIKNYMKPYYKIIIPKSNKHYRLTKNGISIKILKLNEIRYKDPRIRLYNLQTEGDGSYCTSLVSLHNCTIHKSNNEVKLFTRKMEEVTKQFPEVIDLIKENVKAKKCILDSEFVGYDIRNKKYLPFQNISQRIKRKYDIESIAKSFPVEINVFDILNYEGKDMKNEKQIERRKLLEKIIKEKDKKIVLTKKLITDDASKAKEFFEESLKVGNEGLIAKKIGAIYQPGRRVGGWVKLKSVMENLDLAIIGAEWGSGKRAGFLSSFVLGCKNGSEFLECGMIGTGIKEKSKEGVSFKQLTKLLKPLINKEEGRKVKIKPKIIIEVGYEEIQKSPTYNSGYALRFPRVIRLRNDKPLSEIADLKQIEKLYKGQ